MKSLLLFVFILFSFVSCGDKIIEKIEERYPSNKAKTVSFYKIVGENEVKIKEQDFYENGQVRMEGEIKDGMRSGTWKAYFEDGTLWSDGVFANGERNGKGLNYYPNGKLRSEGNYANGKQTGIWKNYNEQGILVEEVDK